MIVRVQITNKFTIIPNEVFELKKFDSIGLISYLLSKPDNWEINIKELRKRAGRDSLRRMFKELSSIGMAKLVPVFDGTKLVGRRWIVTNSPGKFSEVSRSPENPSVEAQNIPDSRCPDFPTVGKPVDIISTDSLTSTDKEEEEKIYKKSEDELFTPPPGGGLSGPNDYSVKDQEEEGRDGERKMGAASSHPARGEHGNDVKTLIYETVVNFYEGWVARYDSQEVRGKVTRTYAGKPTKLITQIRARCKRLGKQALPSFQAVIASKCEYFAEMGMWKNINPQTILHSKFDEYMGRAIDEGWLDESGFHDLKAKATVPPALSPEAEWYQKPGFNIPELDMNELAPDLQKMFIHRQRQWAAVNNNVA